MGFFDPRSRTDEDYQKDVDNGKYDAFKRSDAGGVYLYQTTSSGATLVKDIEPADNSKGHQQTDFIIENGCITSIRSHNDDDDDD